MFHTGGVPSCCLQCVSPARVRCYSAKRWESGSGAIEILARTYMLVLYKYVLRIMHWDGEILST